MRMKYAALGILSGIITVAVMSLFPAFKGEMLIPIVITALVASSGARRAS